MNGTANNAKRQSRINLIWTSPEIVTINLNEAIPFSTFAEDASARPHQADVDRGDTFNHPEK
jgi:hypothetical protein